MKLIDFFLLSVTPFPYRQSSIHKPLCPKRWPLCPKCTRQLALFKGGVLMVLHGYRSSSIGLSCTLSFYRASRPDFRRIPRLAVVLGGVLTVLHDQHFIVGFHSPLTLQPVSSHIRVLFLNLCRGWRCSRAAC